MTKSTITRERLQELAEGQSGFNLRIATHEESQELARIALAALDTEPVGEFYEDGPLNWYQISDGDRVPAHRRIPLYRHAQQAPASEQVYQYWCYTTVENSEGDPEEFWFWKDCEKDFYDLWKNAKRTLYKTPQPALVVPPEQHWEELCRQHPDMSIGDAIIRAAWWNHCRAAMLAAAQQPQNAPQNIPDIIPNELIAAVNRLLDSNGSRGCYSAIKCYDAHIEVERLLAAARQEVRGE
ncbi:TPA: hypothetical protein MCD33_004886 [Klebsiella pneumoniae]|nr:hypothetical protein [Klebsiella pneumoniae]